MGLMDGIFGGSKPIPTPFDPNVYAPQAAIAAPLSGYRAITGSGKRIDLSNDDDVAALRYRAYSEWQNDAWAYYDAIGEIKYGFGMLAAVLSRVRLYSSLNLDPDSVPISTLNYRRRVMDHSAEENAEDAAREMAPPPSITTEVMKAAEEMILALGDGPGGISGFLRDYTLNMAVAGEGYLAQIDGVWQIKSNSELVVDASGNVLLRQQRTNALTSSPQVTSTGSVLGDRQLSKRTPMIRIWRNHPRYSSEPESSMLGLREACDELITLQRMIRIVSRSNMNAGILFIPDGLSVAGESIAEDIAAEQEEANSLVKAIYDNLTEAVVDETNASTVVPTIVTGPADAGKGIQYIELNRKIDQFLTERCDRTLERILQGIDMPKDFVTGLANIRYTNARSIDESLYKSHIEPLVLMLVDALTTAYLRPALKKRFRLSDSDLRSIGIWYDPSEIVTKSNPTESADKGFDNYALSSDAWRQAHGYADTDAPSEDEIAVRMLQKATLPPELITNLFSFVFPNVTQTQREAALHKSPVEFPGTARKMLYEDGTTDSGIPSNPDATGAQPTTDDDGYSTDFSDFEVTDEEAESLTAAAEHPVLTAAGIRGLYTIPYDDNDMQERYRAIAEAAVRSGQSVQRDFPTAKLTPTQPADRTNASGSGAGAKDLPPIVVRSNGTNYLLDGHHRARHRRKITAAFVDVDNLRTTVSKVG